MRAVGGPRRGDGGRGAGAGQAAVGERVAVRGRDHPPEHRGPHRRCDDEGGAQTVPERLEGDHRQTNGKRRAEEIQPEFTTDECGGQMLEI